jgi:hypothetical protein
MRLFYRLMLLLAAAVVFIWAQAAGRGTVTGTVTGANGVVANARVVVASSVSSGYRGATTTDAQGKFSVADVPVGGVTVRVEDARQVVRATATGTLAAAGGSVAIAVRIPAGS